MFTKSDMISLFSDDLQYTNWGQTKRKAAVVQKITSKFVCSCDIFNRGIYATKYEIAKQRFRSRLRGISQCFGLLRLGNQSSTDCIAGSVSRFREFSYEDNDFIYGATKDTSFVNNIVSEGVRVSNLEKTVVDCIDDLSLGGGIDEVLNALSNIRILNEKKLLDVLAHYDKVILYQKVGYVLEHFKTQLSLSDKFFAMCKSKLTKQTKYFLNVEFKFVALNKEWNLIAPTNLMSRINGGL